MNPGTTADLDAARDDARRLPFDTLFSISPAGDWKHLAGRTVHRRKNGGYAEPGGVSFIVHSETHQTIIATASDLTPLGAAGQGDLFPEQTA